MNIPNMVSNFCTVCNSENTQPLCELVGMPVNIGIQWSTQTQAQQCPRGDIRLTFCNDCGHIWNVAFDPQLLDYTESYDNSLQFSAYYRDYAHTLATSLIEKYDLYDKDIIEIGCGNGDFLRLICTLGNNRGVGFDTSYSGHPNGKKDTEQVIFIRDFYSERYSAYGTDLVCCRQVLEHIDRPAEFLATLRNSIDNRFETVIFFEVPTAAYIFRELSVWDIIYEHCSYFSPGSLARLFTEFGFQICDLSETYRGQYITLEARPTDSAVNAEEWYDVQTVRSAAINFAVAYDRRIADRRKSLQQIMDTGQKAVIWGGGAEG